MAVTKCCAPAHNHLWCICAASCHERHIPLRAGVTLMGQRCAGDILLFNDVAVLYKRVEDLILIVTGSQDENEIILFSVLGALSEALNVLMRCAHSWLLLP